MSVYRLTTNRSGDLVSVTVEGDSASICLELMLLFEGGNLRGRQLVVFSSAGAIYEGNSQLQDYLNPYLGQVFKLMGFDKQQFVFIQGTSTKTGEELAQFAKTGAATAASNVNQALL